MPSKPRHGRDYRKRTPRDGNLVQAPGALNGFVTVTFVNLAADTDVYVDFDCPIIGAVDPSVFTITVTPDATQLITDPSAGGATASSCTIVTAGVDPATGRILVHFEGADLPGGVIDPAANFLWIAAAAQDSLQFAARLLYPTPHGQLKVIDTP